MEEDRGRQGKTVTGLNSAEHRLLTPKDYSIGTKPYNGVDVVDTSMREINYSDGVSSIESLCEWRRSASRWVIRL